MKRKLHLKSILLMVMLILGGANFAWAYDTPDGYGVSKVFIGTPGSANANGLVTTVSAEDFEDLASLPSEWSKNTINSISIENVTEVVKPDVNAVPTGVPTYVSGKTFRGYLRKGTSSGKCYAQYSLSEAVSSGKLVFSSDLFQSGNVTGPLILRFLDSSGNPVLTLRQYEGTDQLSYYSYSIGIGDLQTVGSYTTWRTYVGMSIKNLVIDMTTGAASFTMDYIARRKIGSTTNYYRTQTTIDGINIGTGKNIASVQIGKDAISSTDLYFYMDNVELYKLDTYATFYSAAKAEYATKVATLDAAGQAYWTTNTAPTITTAVQYKTAVDALPTTYIAAVKAQTTAGVDMTDAMPTGNEGWTCNQGNGPASYLSTGATETYSDGSSYPKFVAGNIMSQTISGLPNGYYSVHFYGVVNAANSVSSVSGSDLVQAYANATDEDIDVVLQNSCTPTDYLRAIEAQVTDGTLTYGLKAKAGVEDAGNWAVAKIFKLTYLGTEKNSYAINAVAGGSTIKELATGSAWASEEYGTYVPKVVLYNSKYYVLDDADNENITSYHATYTMGASNAIKEINYSLDESIVVFVESGSNITQSSSDNATYSSGNYGHVNSDKSVSMGTLNAGVYTFEASFVNTGNRGLYLRDGNNSNKNTNTIVSQDIDKYSTAGYKTINFSLVASTPIIFTGYTNDQGKYNQSAEFDYVLIRKTGEVATIGSTGWTTFASPYALDLSSLTASEETATAYYAYSASGSTVTMKSTTATVPAGEGLALKGTAGATVTIPVAASGTAIDGNKLTGCTTSTVLDTNANYYVLVNNGGTAEFQCLDAHGATIPAGKAYLDLTGVTLAPTLSIVFEDEATGVNDVRSKMDEVRSEVYNLAGQRVAQPTKGLYIVNGKKVIIK